MRSDDTMKAFTLRVLGDLMKLPYFVWTHRLKDVTVDGFTAIRCTS